MKKTTVTLNTESRDILNDLTKKYGQKSVSEFIGFLSRFLERNDIDLNIELKNGFYNSLQSFDKKIDNHFNKMLSRDEDIIKILRRFEKDYFSKITEINSRESSMPVYDFSKDKEYLNFILSNIKIEESKVTGSKKIILDISENKLEDIKNYVR